MLLYKLLNPMNSDCKETIEKTAHEKQTLKNQLNSRQKFK